MVEEGGPPDHVPHFFECRSPDDESAGTGDEGSGPLQKIGKHKKRDKETELLDWFKLFPASPLLNITNTHFWLQSKYKFLRKSSPFFLSVFDVYQQFFVDKTVAEIYTYSTAEKTTLLYGAPTGDVSSYYYSIEESVVILEELLMYQFEGNHTIIQTFLLDLIKILDRRLPKVNCFFVLSPPSAGKNFFFDCVLHYFFSFGQIGNFGKFQQFPLQECVAKRILLWNEPSCDVSSFDTIKMLFGGDTFNAKIKYQQDAIVTRTPIIVLSNKNIFPKEEAFRCRMIQYTWREAPFLKKYVKKPYPLALYKLFYKYDILQIILQEDIEIENIAINGRI